MLIETGPRRSHGVPPSVLSDTWRQADLRSGPSRQRTSAPATGLPRLIRREDSLETAPIWDPRPVSTQQIDRPGQFDQRADPNRRRFTRALRLRDEPGALSRRDTESRIALERRPGRCTGNVQSYFQHRRAKKQKESSTDRATNSLARATWFIAVLTLAIAGVGFSQYFTFERQLEVMQGQLDEMQAEQRPWINEPRVTYYSHEGSIYHFILTFMNSRKIPTKGLYIGSMFVK
jgi:hypothetical protein